MTNKSPDNLVDQIAKKDRDFFEEAFRDNVVPVPLRRIAERICRAYGIRGICDPMYLANIIAIELKLGDGQSNFIDENTPVYPLYDECPECGSIGSQVCAPDCTIKRAEWKDVVTCKFCGNNVLRITAHRHDNGWVGDDCCWSERLRTTE